MKYLQFGISVLFMIAVLTGCKKDENSEQDGGEYYIRFKINGVQKEYKAQIPNNSVSYFYLDQFEFYNATITGLNNLEDAAQQPVKNMINISVRSKEEIKPNINYQLQNPVVSGGFKYSSIELVYADETGATFGALLLAENYPGVDVRDEVTLTFDQTEGGISKGRFSGKAFGTVNKTEIAITDGEFYLPSYEQ